MCSRGGWKIRLSNQTGDSPGSERKIITMIQVGASFELKTKVTEQNTALAVGSGDVPVFATPMMMALMEGAAAQCLAQFLEEGKTSVGGNISSSHVSATPGGHGSACGCHHHRSGRQEGQVCHRGIR